ncbi:MAG: hypothetical protein HGA25_02830, partial [Clostridiales bacterium]|nr:hypothetical protein [Clostridiales bacterium]
MNLNRTDMQISLAKLTNPEKQTIFENCVADVNIPVGEVFTSPSLSETKGTLHVTKVFLNELEYKDLEERRPRWIAAIGPYAAIEWNEASVQTVFDKILAALGVPGTWNRQM